MKKLTFAAGLLLSLGLTSEVFAADGSITINGKIIDQSCVVNSGTENQTVKLPTISKSTLSQANKTAGTTPFTISLEQCNANGDSVSAFFLPSAEYVNSNGNLNNLVKKDRAEKVDVQLLNENDSLIKVGYNVDQQVVSFQPLNNQSTKVLNYKAQYVSTGEATVGDVQAKVEYNIIYK